MFDAATKMYRCPVCDTVAEVAEQYGLELTCCRTMTPVIPRTGGPGEEFHLPYLELTNRGLKVSVGRREHPMQEDHHIVWIDVLHDRKCHRQLLERGQPPEAVFDLWAADLTVRAYCSLHGLWECALGSERLLRPPSETRPQPQFSEHVAVTRRGRHDKLQRIG